MVRSPGQERCQSMAVPSVSEESKRVHVLGRLNAHSKVMKKHKGANISIGSDLHSIEEDSNAEQ